MRERAPFCAAPWRSPERPVKCWSKPCITWGMWSWRSATWWKRARLYREMLRLCEGWELSYGLVAALTGNARVALAEGELAEARAQLLRAFRIRWRSFPIHHTISALAAMAEIEQAEGRLEAAAELCAALLSWPATPTLHAEHRAAPTTGTGGTLAETRSAVVGGSLRRGRRPGSCALCGGDCGGAVGGELAAKPSRSRRPRRFLRSK